MKEIIDKLNELNKEEIELLLLNLMVTEKLKFESLNKSYVRYLEFVKDKNKKELGLSSNCLAAYVTKLANKNISFFESQAYVVLKDRLDNTFFDKYLIKRTSEQIKKNKEFLK